MGLDHQGMAVPDLLPLEPVLQHGPGEFADFPFLNPHFTPEQLAASASPDRRGLGHTTIHGRPAVDDTGEMIEMDHDEAGIENLGA